MWLHFSSNLSITEARECNYGLYRKENGGGVGGGGGWGRGGENVIYIKEIHKFCS